jgi:hypothetical protein
MSGRSNAINCQVEKRPTSSRTTATAAYLPTASSIVPSSASMQTMNAATSIRMFVSIAARVHVGFGLKAADCNLFILTTLGQTRPNGDVRDASALPLTAEVRAASRNRRDGPILLKKSVHGLDQNFSAPLVRLSETDAGDRIVCTRVSVAASKLIYGRT